MKPEVTAIAGIKISPIPNARLADIPFKNKRWANILISLDDMDSTNQQSQDPEDCQEPDDEFWQATQQAKFWSTGPIKRLASLPFIQQIFHFLFTA
jgi:hypothetical protein